MFFLSKLHVAVGGKIEISARASNVIEYHSTQRKMLLGDGCWRQMQTDWLMEATKKAFNSLLTYYIVWPGNFNLAWEMY